MNTRVGRLMVGLVSLCWLAGCERTEQLRTVVVDSAGVLIVVSSPVEYARDAIQLAPAPHVVLGGLREDPEQEFLGRSGYPTALRLTDGTIVTHDRTRLMVYDSAGEFIRSIGQQGDGPGEFRDILGLCAFAGDTILVSDLRARVSVVVPGEGIVREFVPPGWVVPNVCFADGTVLARSGADDSPSPGMTNFVLVSSTGRIERALPPLPSSVYGLVERVVSYAIHDDHIFVGSGIEMSIEVYSRDGDLKRIIRTRDEATALTPDNVRPGSAAAGGPEPRSAPSPPVGTTRPMYDRMAVDGHGRVWLRIGQQRGADERWVVFERNGALTASLRMIEDPGSVPPRTEPWFGARIVRFGSDEVLVLDQDDFGATRLSLYRLFGH